MECYSNYKCYNCHFESDNFADTIGHSIANHEKELLKLRFMTIRETDSNYGYQTKNFQCILKHLYNQGKEIIPDNVNKKIFVRQRDDDT